MSNLTLSDLYKIEDAKEQFKYIVGEKFYSITYGATVRVTDDERLVNDRTNETIKNKLNDHCINKLYIEWLSYQLTQ